MVVRVVPLAGKSHVTWRVERANAPTLALRMEPRRGILPPYDLPAEARLLSALRGSGIPAPRVLGATDSLTPDAATGRGCLAVEWIEGERFSDRQVGEHAAARYCELLWRIHTLDWRAVGLGWMPLPAGSDAAGRERSEIAARLRQFGIAELPHIQRLRSALDDLGRCLPDRRAPMLVHGDVNFGNFILRGHGGSSRIVAVLDWEQAHLGDPLSDWGRLAAEDLLANLDLSAGARQVMREAQERYGRSEADLHYWTLHQLYKHASATGALSVRHGWEIEPIARMYAEPTQRLLSPDGAKSARL